MSHPSRGRIAVAACVVAAAIGVGAVATGWRTSSSGPPTATAPAHPGVRHDLLVELRDRLVPSAAGGWVVATPAEPSLENWLLASSQAAGAEAAFAAARRAAEERLADDPDGRSLSLALAQALPGAGAGPGSGSGEADRLARDVLARAQSRIAAGDGSWLAVLLQLSAGRSTAAADATAALRRLAGAVGCDRLPAPGPPLAAPASTLTVVLRVLASSRTRCPRARSLLAQAFTDPAWATWVAAPELMDLAAVAAADARPDAATRRALSDHLEAMVTVGPQQPIDLAAVAQVQAARRRVGLALDLPAPLVHHLAGQVAARGGLAGRSTSPPTAFDVAVLRQLAAEELVPAAALTESAKVRSWAAEIDEPDPIVDLLLAGRAPLRCSDGADRAAPSARVTLPGVIADQTRSTLRASCADRLDVRSEVRARRAARPQDQQALRIAATLLAACRIDPSLLDGVAGVRLTVTGPFADDPTVVWSRAVAADPTAACDAVRR